MCNQEKPCRDEIYKPRKTQKNVPSFSSTLLDEIYRSIDGNNAEKSEDYRVYKEITATRLGGYGAKTCEEDEELLASFRRSCLVEKRMQKEPAKAKRRSPLLPHYEKKSLRANDVVFFSSTPSTSNSSGALSSSDTEFFASTMAAGNPKVSCFTTRPKPVRTGVYNRQEDDLLFEKSKAEDDLINSKSRALRSYANLKKVTQHISPGMRLTSFINSLFSNANGKKSRNLDKGKMFQDLNFPNATSTSCSSASRSCLSKYSPRSRERSRKGAQRSVRFHPVSVIVGEDSRPCGHKCIYDEDWDKSGLTELERRRAERNRKAEEAARSALKGYYKNMNTRKIHGRDDEDEENEECLSDSSSDLFELDHSALFGDDGFCEELPVYETTHLDISRAISNSLIR